MGSVCLIYVSETIRICLCELTVTSSAGISTLGWWLGLASVANFVAAVRFAPLESFSMVSKALIRGFVSGGWCVDANFAGNYR
jgi:hypothetical protein